MTYNTIDNDVTMAGGAEGALLANRYRIVRQLGAGGMGSVWLAEDTQLDDKPFAIKMLPPILVANKRAYRQLKDEALVAMKLTHPNIVTLRAFEENNGNPFLVMDYIDGQTLDDCLEDWGSLSEEETVALLKPIAEALDYAHSQGVVHRDIKPANVLVRTDGTPFVLDFGIAREIQETMTRVTGKLSSGTLLYMSPEQLRGQMPMPSQDVYSFAAMAYECLKGEPPFSRGQIEYQILNEQPEPLPGSGVLLAGVMAGLAKKPEDRPPTCVAVLDGTCFLKAAQLQGIENGGETFGRKNPKAADDSPVAREITGVGWKLSLLLVAILAVVAGLWWAKLGVKETIGINESTFPHAVQSEQRQNSRTEGFEFTINEPSGMSMKMKWCSSGEFIMGTSEDEPCIWKQHHVTLTKGFWLGETEVTQGQYRYLMGEERTVEFLARAAYNDKTLFDYGGKKMLFRDIMLRNDKSTTDSDGFVEKFCGDVNDNVPVYFVSWDDASEFCKRLTSQEKKAGRIPDGYEYRLPTEAEWEYACRAGTTVLIPIGRDEEFVKNYVRTNNASALDVIAWWSRNSRMGLKGRGVSMEPDEEDGLPGGRAHAHEVRQKLPNDWGFYDMIGNVREWCYDWYGEYPDKAVQNPQGPSTGTDRVVRGGSWGDDFSCTSGARRWGPPWSKSHLAGFRIALAPVLQQ